MRLMNLPNYMAESGISWIYTLDAKSGLTREPFIAPRNLSPSLPYHFVVRSIEYGAGRQDLSLTLMVDGNHLLILIFSFFTYKNKNMTSLP